MKRGGKGKKGEGGVFSQKNCLMLNLCRTYAFQVKCLQALKGSGLKQRQRQSGLMLLPNNCHLASHYLIRVLSHTRGSHQ